MPEVMCAWCGARIRESPVEHSHGICPSCDRQLRGVPDLSESELDALPFGVIVLSVDGMVQAYNRAESELAGRHPDEVIGRNFFTEVAPCTAVQAFQGAFQLFCAGDGEPKTFRFTFRFPSGSVRVQILFLRKEGGAAVAVRKL